MSIAVKVPDTTLPSGALKALPRKSSPLAILAGSYSASLLVKIETALAEQTYR
jgi:hypothetical protein